MQWSFLNYSLKLENVNKGTLMGLNTIITRSSLALCSWHWLMQFTVKEKNLMPEFLKILEYIKNWK